MPIPSPPSKRERLARFISRLRSKRTSGSSLVVQTGFPTSLADLVVKNRAKFRKRKKPSHSSDLDSAASVAVRSESDGSGDGRPPAVESPNRIDEGIEALPVSAPARMRRRGVGFGLGFFMVKVAALMGLAVGRKWVVAGITVLTFGLWALELCGLLKPISQERNVIERFDLGGRGLVPPIREEVEDYRNSECSDSRSDVLLERRDFDAVVNNNKDRDLLRLRPNERNSLETDFEVFHLRGRELVSPIREIEPWNHQNASGSERISYMLVQSKGSLGNSEVLNSRSDTFLESKVLDATENIINNQDVGNSRKSKRKKLFRKLFNRKKREKKDEKELNSSYLDGSRVSNEVLTEEDEGCNGDDIKENSDEEYFSFEACDEVTDIDREDSNVAQDNGGEIRSWMWRKLVFIVIVLLGLLGGKGLALALTVAWYLLSGCTRNVWKKWKMQ